MGSRLRGIRGTVAGGMFVMGIASARTAHAQAVPTDAAGGCPIPPATVAGFFESGSVTLNGVVKPADSTAVLVPNCGFFQWTEQMFLWLTSPASARYGGGSHIMFSPQFFTVTPEDGSGRREFLPNSPGSPLRMQLRATELGPNGLPVVMSRAGQIVEVQRERPGAKPPVIRSATGQILKVVNLKATPGGKLQFLDARGRVLEPSFPRGQAGRAPAG